MGSGHAPPHRPLQPSAAAFVAGLGLRLAARPAPLSAAVSRARAPVRCCQPPLSERARALIVEQQAHPLFDASKASPADLRAILARAQAEGAFVEARLLPTPGDARARAADAIRVHVDAGIDGARATVVREFPGIDQPGGALHPEYRATACWRDLYEFARVLSYAVATGNEVYSDKGVEVMKMVYEELGVPIDPMCMGIAVLGQEIGERMGEDYEARGEVGQAFGTLLEVFGGF